MSQQLNVIFHIKKIKYFIFLSLQIKNSQEKAKKVTISPPLKQEVIKTKEKTRNNPKKPNLLPTGTRGRAWQGEISFIPKDVLDHKSPLQKFDEIHAKYLTAPRDEGQTFDLKHKKNDAGLYTHFVGGISFLNWESGLD